jgi:hypothetical protein
MKELIVGHSYSLDNLKDPGETVLTFYMDPALHDGEHHSGPSTQEVIRACIARTQALHQEKPHPFNALIIEHLRKSLAYFEMRALLLHIEKGFSIEKLPTNSEGHIL